MSPTRRKSAKLRYLRSEILVLKDSVMGRSIRKRRKKRKQISTDGDSKNRMKRIRFLSVIIVAALSASWGPSWAGSTARNDPWASFYTGSWIMVKEVETFLGNTKTSVMRRKITSKKEGLAEVWNFTEDGSRRLSKERDFLEGRTPENLFMKQISRKPTRLRIGTRSYKATKVSYVPDGKFSLARGPLTIYRTDALEVPYREMLLCGDDIALPNNVIRAEYVAPDRNTGKLVRYESQIVHIHRMLSIENEQIPCYIEETKVVDISSSEQIGEVKRWISDRLPGHTVKLEYRFKSPYGSGEFYQSVQKYHLVKFRLQSIEMGGARISFEIPGNFRSVSRSELAYRFPMGPETTRAFTTDDNRASIIVQILEPSVLIHKVEELKLSIDKQLHRRNPNISQIGKGLTEINERKFVYQELVNTAAGSEVHTYNLETLHRGKIVSLDFSMNRELFPEYEQLWRIWVGSIKIE